MQNSMVIAATFKRCRAPLLALVAETSSQFLLFLVRMEVSAVQLRCVFIMSPFMDSDTSAPIERGCVLGLCSYRATTASECWSGLVIHRFCGFWIVDGFELITRVLG